MKDTLPAQVFELTEVLHDTILERCKGLSIAEVSFAIDMLKIQITDYVPDIKLIEEPTMHPNQVTTHHAKVAIDHVKTDPLLSDEERKAALSELAEFTSVPSDKPVDLPAPPPPPPAPENLRINEASQRPKPKH